MPGELQSRPYSAWQLIKSYWQSDQRFFAYFMLGSVIFLSLFIVGMEVVLNYWYNYFYDSLQDYNTRSVLDLLIVFVFLATILIVLQVYRFYVQNYLALRWRRWLTHQFFDRWLAHNNYYCLENFEDNTDNPDQRIQEDINALVSSTLDLSLGLLVAITSFFGFVFVLWTLSGPLHFSFGPFVLHIPGYLVWVAIIYALIGTKFTIKIGRSLVPLNFNQQKLEANFRFAAVDLRSHSEHVALYRGEAHQKNIFSSLFERVLENWYAIILRQKLLMWFTAGYNQVAVLVPLVVALPNYFSKVFKLGGLMQTLRAFGHIQDSLSFIVNSYNTIAQWQAVVQRLITFLNHMYESEKHVFQEHAFEYKQIPQDKIQLSKINILKPHGEKLLANINEEMVHGKNYLIKGASGIGKSTLIRVIAGIWPFGSGEISLPQHKKLMYLPQRAYMPIGTLKEALLFPNNVSASDDIVIQLLKLCGLENLVSRLHEVAAWSGQLSIGEQQRVAFVRIFLQKPDWVFLDESTSALDTQNESNLYELLKKELPNCSVVSIAHQSTIEKFHDVQIDLSKYRVVSLA